MISFTKNVFGCKIALDNAAEDHKLLVEIITFMIKTKTKKTQTKTNKLDTLESLYDFFEGRGKILNTFKNGIVPLPKKGTGRPSDSG